MGWEKELRNYIKDVGHNTDVRILEGVIKSTAPLTFQPDISTDVMNARFSESVATDAAVGQAVLAIQDMATRRCYVIARLI